MSIGVPDDDPRLLAVIALADPEKTGSTVRDQVARKRPQETADPRAAMYIGIAAEKAGDLAPGRPSCPCPRRSARAGPARHARSGSRPPRLGRHSYRRLERGDAGRHRSGDAGARYAAAAVRGHRRAGCGSCLRAARRGHRAIARGAGACAAGGRCGTAARTRPPRAWRDGGRRGSPRGCLSPSPAGVRRKGAGLPSVHALVRRCSTWSKPAVGCASTADWVAGVVDELEWVGRDQRLADPAAGLACAKPLLAGEEEAEALFVRALDGDLAGSSVPAGADAVLLRPLAAPATSPRPIRAGRCAARRVVRPAWRGSAGASGRGRSCEPPASGSVRVPPRRATA